MVAVFNVTSPPLADTVVVPLMFNVPVSVTAAVPVAVLVNVKSPSTVESPITSAVVPPWTLTSPAVSVPLSLVVINKAPVKAFDVVPRVIVASSADVMRVVVPSISSPPLCVIFPVVEVACKSPPTEDAANCRPTSFATVAFPVPWVLRPIVPSTARSFSVILPLFASVVAVRFPSTVTTPESPSSVMVFA